MPLHRIAHRSWQAIFVAVLAISLGGSAPEALAQRAKTAPAKRRSLLEGPPLTLEQLTKFIETKDASGGRLLSDKQVAEILRSRKADFAGSRENIEKLQSAGAGQEVIDALNEVAPPPPEPVKPPEPPKATLTVTCAPAECSIAIEGSDPDKSTSGTFTRELPVGTYNVEVSRSGFVPEKQTVMLSEEGKTVDVRLRADESTKAGYGAGLLNRMLAALGQGTLDAAGKGSLTRIRPGAAPSEWSLTTRFGGTLSSYLLEGPAGGYELECKGETCARKGRRKEVKGQEAANADQDLRLFRRYYATGLVRDLRTGAESSRFKATAESDEPAPDGTHKYRLESPDETLDIVLDAQFLPQNVTSSSKVVSATTMKLAYSDYVEVSGHKLPKRATITLPNVNLGAIQVRFDTLDPAPSLKRN